MSDSPPPITDDDEVVDTKHNESNDLFFSTIGDSSDNKQFDDMDDIFKQAKKEIGGSLSVTNEIRLDEDDSNVNRTSLDKPFSLSSTHTLTSVPVAASINILPQIPVNKKPESQVESGSKTLFNSKNAVDDVDDDDDEDRDKFIEINVIDPVKIGEGMSSYMTYKVTTRTNYPFFKSKEFSVNRRFSDFLHLFEKLKEKHLQLGRFLPSAPEKDMLGTTKLKMSKDDAAPNEFIERRKAALDRFLNRCAKHPQLKYDPDYRDFLEATEYSSKSLNASKFDVIKVFKNVGDAMNKISVKITEPDQWFDEKALEVDNLHAHLKKLYASVDTLCGWRRDHSSSIKEFAKSASVLAHSEEHISLAKALSQLGDVYEKIEQLVADQAHSDFFVFCELLKDYIGLLELIKEAFYQRVKIFQTWQKAEETLKAKQETKAKLEASNKQDKIPTAMAEIKTWEEKVDKGKEEFEQISKTIKQEMKRFDKTRIVEFKKSLTIYLQNLLEQQQARPTGITCAIHGNFSGTKQQEIIVSRGKILEILRHDPNTGKVYTLLTEDVFSVIRSMMPVRLTGGTKDYVIIGSDSGRVVILEYNPTKNIFEKVHQETFGKSGCRRIVPGQYLATDPKGRAFMIGAVEKQKLVYILNRDAQAHLTISSPLEAHKSSTICFNLTGVDVGFENPMFACLEVDYEEADHSSDIDPSTLKQNLTFYELDLGLNHVVRKYSESLDIFANFLIAVPGGNEGPSGVLICCENYIIYKNFGDQADIKCPIPRRRTDLDDADRSMIFVCSATHKTKSMFFFLVQSDQGDIFKVTLQTDEDFVTEVKIKYFDTTPVASAMCVLKTGFLFVASEFGNHYLYQIAHLGDDDDEPEFSSAMQLEEGETFFFEARALKNLVLVDEMDSLSPIVSCQIADLANEDTPQIYTACGRGSRSTMRVLRHGLEVSEMAVSELPGNPNAVWTVKRRADDEFDSYIIVSFLNATLVLSISETVEEVTDSGFLGTMPTLCCAQIGEDALVQIYPEGIRHIRADKRVNEWKAPAKRQIIKSAVNQRQVVIALTGGELVYFEMDPTGQLNEYTERKEMLTDVVCMALASVPEGELRTRFLAVGLADDTVRIISLDPKDCLTPLASQALPAPAESLCIVEMKGLDYENAGIESQQNTLFLNIGLLNGVLLRTVLDSITGELLDTRTRYLGSRPIKLFKILIQGNEAVLAMSSRSWLNYMYQGRFHLTPLSYESLEYASGFASEQCPEGIVAISSNTLRILALEKLGAVFNQETKPLKYTPRKFVIHPDNGILYMIETEHLSYTEKTKQIRKHQMAQEMIESASESDKKLAAETAKAFLNEKLPENIFGQPKAAPGMWSSLIRIMDPLTLQTRNFFELEQNEAAFSIALVRFSSKPNQTFLLVGVARDLVLNPRSCVGGYIYTYQLFDNGDKLDFIHKTPIEEVPGVMCSFQGRVLVAVGRLLRIYDIGKKKLLRKCENKQLPNFIANLHTMGNRIFAGDIHESFFFLRYKRGENQMIIFADDSLPRFVTASCVLDYDTVAVADKFGTISIIRLPTGSTDDVNVDPTGDKGLWDRGILNGASQKFDVLCSFYLGETPTTLQKTTLIPGGGDSIVYTTLSGSIGIIVPFSSNEDHDFFQHLEMHMRSEFTTLCGRDHMAFRSYYTPIRNVVDGDLCERFSNLESNRQKTIAGELDRTPNDVLKRLEDIRTRFAF